jgi:putative Mn2+ efflux pump MntP
MTRYINILTTHDRSRIAEENHILLIVGYWIIVNVFEDDDDDDDDNNDDDDDDDDDDDGALDSVSSLTYSSPQVNMALHLTLNIE